MNYDALYSIIQQRIQTAPGQSYTAHLAQAGEDEILKKIGEEAIEVILAAKAQGDVRLVEEIADLTYHVLVLMAVRGIAPEDVRTELAQRNQRHP